MEGTSLVLSLLYPSPIPVLNQALSFIKKPNAEVWWSSCPTPSGGCTIYAWSFLISLATVIGSEADMPKLGHLEIHIGHFCQS